jgi:hypothetical protein
MLSAVLGVRRIPIVEVTHDLNFSRRRSDEDELHRVLRPGAKASATVGRVTTAARDRGASRADGVSERERDREQQYGGNSRNKRPDGNRSRT